jgi:hypothetical protein
VAGAPATDARAAALGLPPIDGLNLWPSWTALADPPSSTRDVVGSSRSDPARLGTPRTIVLATRFGRPGTPYGGTSALIDVRQTDTTSAFKLLRGVVCECPECRPCLMCNATHGGCVFDVVNDPGETRDLAAERPELLAALSKRLKVAMAGKFVDDDPVNQECWEQPRDRPNHWMEVALARGAVMQPWLRTPTRRGAKPKVLHPQLAKLGKAP